MKLNISNLNIVGNAEININGLAVIAGENGTGKSTVGKTLFATLKAIAALRRNISTAREKAITDLADPIFSRLYRLRLTADNSDLDLTYPTSRALFINEICSLTTADDVYQYFAKALDAISDQSVSDALRDEIEALASFINQPAETSIDLSLALNRLLRSEFLGNISADNPDGKSQVTFTDEMSGMSISYNIEQNEPSVIKCDGQSAFRDVTYIESPLYLHLLDILGKVSGAQFFDKTNPATSMMLPAHVADIVEKIESLKYAYDVKTINSQQVSSTLAEIAGGEFFYDTSRHAIMFRQGDNNIVPLNVASGVKSLGLLHILLDNKIIGPDRPLIWDEPENHLHPSWQIRLAQFLVMLAAQGIPIVVSTHSPYFIQGIRHYAVKLHAEHFVDYYLTEMEGATSITQCVNDDLNRIFIKLAAPLNEIMDLSE